MKLEWHWKSVGFLLSLAGMWACRNHPILLVGWAVLSLICWILGLCVVPARLQREEQRRLMQTVRLCDASRFAEAEKEALGPWWLRLWGHRQARLERMALVWQSQGQCEKAESALKEALEQAPIADRPRLELNLSQIEARSGRAKEAKQRLDRLLREHPELRSAAEKTLQSLEPPPAKPQKASRKKRS